MTEETWVPAKKVSDLKTMKALRNEVKMLRELIKMDDGILAKDLESDRPPLRVWREERDSHKTTKLMHNGREIPIDTMIAPLMQEVWKAGCETHNSCENNHPWKYVWIEFADSSSAEHFMNIVTTGNHNRPGWINTKQNYSIPDQWFFNCLTENSNVRDKDEDEEDDDDDDDGDDDSGFVRVDEGQDHIFSISIRFPQTDLEFVFNQMKAYNERKNLGEEEKN